MNYYNEIKNELINNEVYKKVKDYSKNRSDLKTYYNVGKLLSEAGKHYGEGIIKKYSVKLTNELGKGYSVKSLFKFRKFYNTILKVSTMSRILSWSHYDLLLKFDDIIEFNYYVKITEEQNLSVRDLRQRIKSNEYDRLDDKTKMKLKNHEKEKATDFIKNPILIKNKYNTDKISEKMLKQLILEDLDSFLKELGKGFTYVSTEYPIKIGNRYNYIDLLLFNYIDNCFVVVELKITEFKAEYVGQVLKYINYIDKNIKDVNQSPTLGIIICKKNNRYIIQYVTNKNIIEREYKLIV